jgi:hypothetical protein
MSIVLRGNIRYDKHIKANAKLLYGEITALANRKGYCWATDKYFAQLYGKSRNTVNLWIQALKKYGYISIDYAYEKDSAKIAFRKIAIINNKDSGITKNGGENTTRRNSTRRLNTTRSSRAKARTDFQAGFSFESVSGSSPEATPDKPKEPPLIEREPKNDQERVLKPYLANFQRLYEQGRVTSPAPVIHYAQAGKQIKTLLSQKISVDRLIAAVDRAAGDAFVVEGGYTFSTCQKI